MMKTFGSVSITSHRSSDSVSSEVTDELWSPDPSSGYCSADDEHSSYDLRTPTAATTAHGRSLSESSTGISSRSLLSLSLSEALSLTFCESPPPSPPPPPPRPRPPDDVPPFQDLVDSRSPPGSSIECESSSLSSTVPTTSDDEFPRIISSQPNVVSFLGRLQPCSKRCSNFEKHRGVEPQTVTTEADHILPSKDIQADLLPIETNSAQETSEDSRYHKKIRLQHKSCSEENNDLSNEAGSKMTVWSSRSCSTHTRENSIIDEVRKEQCGIPEAHIRLQYDGSIVEEENVADDDTMYLVAADGDLKSVLPNSEGQIASSDEKTVCTTPSHPLLAGRRIEPRRNFDASSSDHSKCLLYEEDLHLCSPDGFDREFSATDCYKSPHFAVDTGSTIPTGSSTHIGSTPTQVSSTTSTGSTSSIVPTVSTGVNNSADLKAFRITVGLFHSYAAAVKETSDSSNHSTTSSSSSCSPHSQDLRFIDHDIANDLRNDPMLPDAQTTILPGHSQDPFHHHGSVSTWSTTNEEVLQETIEDACNVHEESSRSGNASSLSVDSIQRIGSLKRSRSSSSSSYRQSSKRRRRHSSSALAELADHGYALKGSSGPASTQRSSTSPSVVTVEEEESTSTADVSSVLAKLLLTDEQLFPNEGSAGFIARRQCSSGSAESSARSQEPSGGQGLSGSLLERLLTGQMDRDEIQRSEERVIRDRMEARPDDNNKVVADEDVDLQLQDFDPGSLELENLEELWKNYGDLLGKFLA